MENFVTTYEKLKNIISLMSIKDCRCLFSSFFWPIDEYIGITEGSRALIASSSMQKNKYSLAFRVLLYNARCIFIQLLKKILMSKPVLHKTVYGNFNKDIDCVVYTWLCKDQISSFINKKKDVYWGEFFLQLESKKPVQILIHAEDPAKWNKEDIEILIK
ncbi:MAG: hypothetical protein HQK51_20725, partial [Oligoflexia bacterium]|nr:hypothetical protein [Oligoflexia bacterium]